MSCENYMKIRNTVKVRKDFTCYKCQKVFIKGSTAVSWTMVDGTDFFERKFCVECNELESKNE